MKRLKFYQDLKMYPLVRKIDLENLCVYSHKPGDNCKENNTKRSLVDRILYMEKIYDLLYALLT